MQFEILEAPRVLRNPLRLVIDTKGPISTTDQKTIRRRLDIVRTEHGIHLRPYFSPQDVVLNPTTEASQKKLKPRNIRSILSRMEVPHGLGFVLDTDPK